MPITYQIDHTHRRVDAFGHGVLRDADVFRYQQEVWGRAEVAGYDEIVDMSKVTSIEGESVGRIRELAELSAQMDSASTPSKFAIVVSKFPYIDLAHVYETYRALNAKSTKRVRTFETRDDAMAWLAAVEEKELPPKAETDRA